MDDLWKMKMHLDDMRWYDRIHVLVSDFMLRWSNKHESVKRSISMPALDSQETSLSKHYINFLGIVPGDFLLSMMINSPSNHHFWNIFHFFPPTKKSKSAVTTTNLWYGEMIPKKGPTAKTNALKMDEHSSPEKRPFQKENRLRSIIFQGLCLFLGGVSLLHQTSTFFSPQKKF